MTRSNAIFANGPDSISQPSVGAAGPKISTAAGTELPPNSLSNSNETVVSVQAVTGGNSVGGGNTDAAGFTHDDADIQAYLNRLLKQGSGGKAGHENRTVSEAPPAKPAPPSPEPAAQAWDPSEYVPKAIAPEKMTNLDALREIANQSIRSAIEVSQKKQHSARSIRYLGLATAGAVLGGVLLMLSSRPLDLWMTGGIASFLASIYPAWKFTSVTRAELIEKRMAEPSPRQSA